MREIKSNLPTGMKGFFAWLAQKQPAIYARVMARLRESQLSGLGITSPDETPAVANQTQAAAPSTAQKIKDVVLALSQGYLTVQQMRAQEKVLDMQLQRAKTGQPPLNLDMAQYGLTGPQVSVGLSPDVKKLLIYGGIGFAALIFLPKLLKGRA